MMLLTLDLSTTHLTDEQFYQLCIKNQDLRLERTNSGDLIVMSPVGGESGSRELEFGIDLGVWNRQTKLGKVFSSSTIFKRDWWWRSFARCELGRIIPVASTSVRTTTQPFNFCRV